MLIDAIKSEIARHGPLRVDRFMDFALSHYYSTRDPFGPEGDFTTAPEISQMFGEMIGVWAADTWHKLGSPKRFVLLECGPGRGTLMADLLRATQKVEGFHAALEVYLLEISPVLKEQQKNMLQGIDITWHEGIDTVPDDVPIIMIANEFFDALPIRQGVYQNEVWCERVVDVRDDELVFDVIESDLEINRNAQNGDVFEFSPARESFMHDLCVRIKKQSGAALIIDYGHAKSAVGDTLQGVYKHEYCDVLKHIGEADLTSHVDFEALANIAGAHVDGPVAQGDFLQALGIEIRAQILARKTEGIQKDLHRLVNPSEMGTLFKVMGVRYGIKEPLAGFR